MRRPAGTLRLAFAGALSVVAIAAFAGHAHAEDRFVVRASAGLGGLVKPGRAAPVTLDIEQRGGPAAEHVVVVVSWGDAVVRRHVFMGSAGTRHAELILRTTDAQSLVRVSIEGEPSTLEIPVTVLPNTARVTLCVSQVHEFISEAARCTTTLEPRQLPRSPYAYEVADDVVIAEGSQLSDATQLAINRWRNLARIESSGDMSLTPQVTRPLVPRGLPAAVATSIRLTAGFYAAFLLIVGFVFATTRFAPRSAWSALAGLTAAATAAALLLGNSGPTSRITVHHTSLLQQIPGTDGALITIRGITEFPTNGDLSLRSTVEDGSLEVATASGRAEQVVDENGFPVLVTRAGLGGRQAWSGEAITQARWLAVTDRGGVVVITNLTSGTLESCRFADGFSMADVGPLPPGGSVTAMRTRDFVGPMFTCASTRPALSLIGAARSVDMIGTTTVAVYRDRPASAPDAEAPND